MPGERPTFASRHPHAALVNGICYGYFSNPEAAADTAQFWAWKLAQEQRLQCNLPPRKT